MKGNEKIIGAIVGIIIGVLGSLGVMNSDSFKEGICKPESAAVQK